MTRFLTLLAGLLLAGQSLAHSPLQGSAPADGSTLAAAPTEVVLEFSKAVRLAGATLVFSGERHKLALAGATTAKRFSVPMPASSPSGTGDYALEWRALAEDGHVMRGTLRFVVD